MKLYWRPTLDDPKTHKDRLIKIKKLKGTLPLYQKLQDEHDMVQQER